MLDEELPPLRVAGSSAATNRPAGASTPEASTLGSMLDGELTLPPLRAGGSPPATTFLPPASSIPNPSDQKTAPAPKATSPLFASSAFFESIPWAFVYPLIGRGAIAIYGFVAVVLICAEIIGRVMFQILIRNPSMGEIAGYGILTLILVIEVYLASYIFHAGSLSANGEDELPGLPDLGDAFEQVVVPAALLFITVFVCALPFFIYNLNEEGSLNFKRGFWYLVLSLHDLVLRTPKDEIGWCLVIPGMLYYPMALVCVMVTGSLRGLDPRLVLRGIVTVPLPYLLVLAFVHLKFHAWRYAIDHWFKFSAFDMMGRSGLFLPGLLLLGSAIYLLLVQARLLGMLYHCHRKRLAFVLRARAQ
jgi:hypothetical protein